MFYTLLSLSKTLFRRLLLRQNPPKIRAYYSRPKNLLTLLRLSAKHGASIQGTS
jgi:hypothetical protein